VFLVEIHTLVGLLTLSSQIRLVGRYLRVF